MSDSVRIIGISGNIPATPPGFRANAQFGRVFPFRQGANHQSVIGASIADEKSESMIRESPDSVRQIRDSVSEIEKLDNSADVVCGI